MKLKKRTLWAGLVIIIIAFAGVKITGYATSSPGQYDNFAQCLTDEDVKMYGAYWCPHCNNQKRTFGDSWKYINYIECSLPDRGGQTQECAQEGITGYPTWEFSDGSRISGEVPFETLAARSGCELTDQAS